MVEGVDVLELGVRVFGRMGVVDAGDFGEVVGCGAVSIAVFLVFMFEMSDRYDMRR